MPYRRHFYTDLQAHSEVILLWCYFCRHKGLENGLADRTSKSESKSKSIAFKSKSKSKSSKNGLKSRLESKSGLEYCKSGRQVSLVAHRRLPFTDTWVECSCRAADRFFDGRPSLARCAGHTEDGGRCDKLMER